MEREPASEVTRLLQEWRNGDRAALDTLLPLFHKELRRLAHAQLRKERPDHTLQNAALVSEAYLRLIGLRSPQWESRTHFFAIAARLMRQILVDYARRYRTEKRAGGPGKLSIENAKNAMNLSSPSDVDVIALDDALNVLATLDPRQSRVVELKFFGGLSLHEISTALDIAPATVQRPWTAARATLHRQISKSAQD